MFNLKGNLARKPTTAKSGSNPQNQILGVH
jgi:hypothetical protein